MNISVETLSRHFQTTVIGMILLVSTILMSGCTPSPAIYIETTPSVPPDQLEVVYFHRPQRCSGCIYAETGIQYTLENYFAGELESGMIIFKVINLGDEANEAIIEKYGAHTSSLYINSIVDGTDHIEEVPEIWFVLHEDSKFVAIVKDKIESSLGEP